MNRRLLAPFQFHTGAIKKIDDGTLDTVFAEFQSHYGAIKRISMLQ